MTGTLAQTIQGEAGASGASGMFAVAATIANRQAAGTFPGGTDLNAIVNAPQQFVGFNATPSPTAQALATALQNGTLSQYGSTGNAVNFQSGGAAVTAGGNSVNIGGNIFSDRFGPASSNFVAPSYAGGLGGTASSIADGPADNSTGGNTGYSVTANPSGTSPTTAPPAQGTQIQTALQPEETNFITSTVNSIESAMGTGLTKTITAAETAVGNYLGGLQNWFIRAAVILLGVVLIAIALVVLMWDHGGKQVATTVTRAA
jgi:hypothetical protein